MGSHMFLRACLAVALVAAPAPWSSVQLGAQAVAVQSIKPEGKAKKVKVPNPDKPIKAARGAAFYDSEVPIDVTFTSNLRALRGDKGTTPPWRSATISYVNPEGKPVVVPVKARTRGIWRLKNCDFPPVRLDFAKADTKGTFFQNMNKSKLVSYCRDNDTHEEYVLQELQLYRVQKLLTPMSHRARLVRMAYTDSASGRAAATRFAFIMEDLADVAARVGGTEIQTLGARAGDLDPEQDAIIGVFQYFIGNTDFSIGGLHNAELVQRGDGSILPIAYDFDFSGAVNTRYATVDPTLAADRVRDRLFRGFCVDRPVLDKVMTLFNDKKPEIYALYRDDVGKRLTPRTIKETLEYFDEFYKTINNPRSLKREILDACRPRS